jgi:hypothetical protein
MLQKVRGPCGPRFLLGWFLVQGEGVVRTPCISSGQAGSAEVLRFAQDDKCFLGFGVEDRLRRSCEEVGER